MKLSIIIVNYQSRAYLERCLASLFAKIGAELSFEVLVVNNSLEGELVGLEIVSPRVKLIQNSKNSGFGAANNLGAKSAQGELLLFLNPDTEIVDNNISSVIAEFRSDQELGILGSRLIDGAGKVQKWIAGEEVSLWGIIQNNFGIIADEKYWKSEKKTEVAWVAGTAMFVRKALFDKISGFDEQFFLYFEDTDFCRRARLFGKKVVYFPEFSVLHHEGKSFAQKKSQKKAYYHSQDYYFKKHRGFFEALLLRGLRVFSF